jgi:ABC-type spermidine/putrescine transport system permease subunit I
MLFFLFPTLRFLSQSLFDPDFTLKHYTRFFTGGLYLTVLWRTLIVSLITTICCVILGYPVAFVLARASGGVKFVVIALVLIPFWTNILVRMFAWIELLGRNGIINRYLLEAGLIGAPLPLLYNMFSVVLGMTHVMLPYLILPCYAVMVAIPSNLSDAAANLGAPPYKAFWRVYFPLSLPGLGAGALLVFIISIGFFITPALMGGANDTMLAQVIESQVNETFDWGSAAAMSTILLALTIALYFLYERLIGVDKIYDQGKMR